VTYQCKKWFYGLASGFIGGGAGSAASTLTACVIKPTAFNLNDQVNATICFATAMFAINGLSTAFLFLRQSPLPPMETDTAFVKRLSRPVEVEEKNLPAEAVFLKT
jgi:hypothetical protein